MRLLNVCGGSVAGCVNVPGERYDNLYLGSSCKQPQTMNKEMLILHVTGEVQELLFIESLFSHDAKG